MKKHLFVFLVFLCPLIVFSQNVGIGNDIPLMKLHITNIDSSVLLLENTQALGTGINTSMYFKTGNGTYPYTGGIKTIGTGPNLARLGLFTYAASSPNGLIERMSILDGGNVGIGTTLPTAKLTIDGTYSDPSIPGVTSNGILRIGPTNEDALDIGKVASFPYAAWLQAGTSGTAEPISFQPLGGNVGIGLLSPSSKLEVEGGIKADSLDVQSGLIKNVADPINAQDAATKAYVDLLESKVDLLLGILIDNGILYVQDRLDLGETPIEIYNSDNSLLDSLYGKTYQEGLIAYLNTSTGTGLVAAPSDQSAGTDWGCYGTAIAGTSSEIGTGQSNTTLIVNGCAEVGIAARLCDELVIGMYDDWFLPSRDELNEMYINLKQNGFGGFSSDYYWSSTEFDSNSAWEQDFLNGGPTYDNKFNYGLAVRAVRAY